MGIFQKNLQNLIELFIVKCVLFVYNIIVNEK